MCLFYCDKAVGKARVCRTKPGSLRREEDALADSTLPSLSFFPAVLSRLKVEIQRTRPTDDETERVPRATAAMLQLPKLHNTFSAFKNFHTESNSSIDLYRDRQTHCLSTLLPLFS
jgi:hypothetical protein